MSSVMKIKEKLSSFQIIILGFAGVILLGAILLMLPISSKAGVVTPFGDALFTSTSAVCVTGLVVKDTATYWSYFGQAIILIMIQIGGLGVITVASLLSLLVGKKIGLMQRQTMQNAISAPQVGGIVKLTKFIFFASFGIEVVGALLLLPVFVPQFGAKGIWMSFFHSISAFCNAGFDLMGEYTGEFSSLTSYIDNGYLTFVICMLIIVGGIGFLTWNDVVTKRHHFKEYRMQSKVIIVTSLLLIVVPAIFFFLVDYAGDPIGKRVCESIFQSVTTRTAGFNTADFGAMTDSSKGISMMLMLVGGSPGSTAGGMKTTTLAILFANAIAIFRKRKNANYFGRRIDDSIVKNAATLCKALQERGFDHPIVQNAATILFMYVSFAMIAAIAINLIEGLSMDVCMFETFSAIATVGLSLGATPGLGAVSHAIIIFLMFFGRVGGLTIIYAAFSHQDNVASKYPLENIMIG